MLDQNRPSSDRNAADLTLPPVLAGGPGRTAPAAPATSPALHGTHGAVDGEAFLSVLSHELRTPITTIYAGSFVLARQSTLSPPASRVLAGDISLEAARLYDVVEDLLVLARLDRGLLSPFDEPVHLGRTVESAARSIEDRLPGLIVKRSGTDHPSAVRGDSSLVEHAVRNLALAVARVADASAAKGLSMIVEEDQPAGEVRLRIDDGGPRLTPGELQTAFDLPSTSGAGRLAAAGLALYVCRQLIESMHGRVWAANLEGSHVELGLALRIDDRA